MNIDIHSCARLLQSCNSHNLINHGKQLHLLFLKSGVLDSTLTIGNRLLQMYIRCGSIIDASKLFDEMPLRNCFSWNTMIEGYLNLGNQVKTLHLFNLMPEKNEYSWNMVVSRFVKAGELGIARELFDEMPRKNVVVLNSMIHGYVCKSNPREGLRLFKDFSCRDSFVMATVIGACSDLEAQNCGKQIHARIVIDEVEFDSVLISSLINLYGKCGDLDSAHHLINLMKDPDSFSLSALISGYAKNRRLHDARIIFNRISKPNAILWNSIISGYILNNEEDEALALFNEMRKNGVCEDPSTFSSILSACSSLGVLEYVRQMHNHAIKVGVCDDLVIATALVDTYSKCGCPNVACKLFTLVKLHDTILLNSMITIYSNCGRINDAKMIFEKISNKSLISWNSMLVGFTQNGFPFKALNLFYKMNKQNLKIDNFSLASAITACASVSSLELGEQVFTRIIIIGLQFDHVISTSLVDFYCKCGDLKKGRKLFDETVKLDHVSWNSMLMGYATNGYGLEALNLIKEMIHKHVPLTDITFTAILSACDHCGLVEEGRTWFYSMKQDYDIDPTVEHYSCMIDLLARAGYLEESMDLIEQMKFEVDASMLSSVLRGCVAHGDKRLGKKVAEQILQLDPQNSSAYVQLSSILASDGDWDRSARVREVMKEKQIEKNPGRSWGDG